MTTHWTTYILLKSRGEVSKKMMVSLLQNVLNTVILENYDDTILGTDTGCKWKETNYVEKRETINVLLHNSVMNLMRIKMQASFVVRRLDVHNQDLSQPVLASYTCQ
jgi:hypothetical protein